MSTVFSYCLIFKHSELDLVHKIELDSALESCIVDISIIWVWSNCFLSSVYQGVLPPLFGENPKEKKKC